MILVQRGILSVIAVIDIIYRCMSIPNRSYSLCAVPGVYYEDYVLLASLIASAVYGDYCTSLCRDIAVWHSSCVYSLY